MNINQFSETDPEAISYNAHNRNAQNRKLQIEMLHKFSNIHFIMYML